MHGGGIPAVKAKAAERLALAKAEAQVRKALAGEPFKPVEDPFEQLALLAGEAVAWKETIGELVDQLKTIRYTAPGAGTEQLRAEIVLYERAMDRAAKFVSEMAKHNFEERRIRLAEGSGQMLASVVRTILNQLDLTPEQWDLTAVVVPRELRAVAEAERARVVVVGELQ